jgi:hypothetical protein
MPLFITAGKVRSVLREKGANGCVEELGQRCNKPLLALICSDKEDMNLRKNAIDALFLFEEQEPGKSSVFVHTGLKTFSDKFSDLPAELRKAFIEHAFSEQAGARISLFFIKVVYVYLFWQRKVAAKKDIRDYILASKDARLDSLLRECLVNEPSSVTIKVECAEMLVAKLGVDAAPSILAALRANNIRYDAYLVDRLVDMLNKHDVTGSDVEDVLIEKLDQIAIGDIRQSIKMMAERLQQNREDGWELFPDARIIEGLSRVGGKKALASMLKKFTLCEQSLDNPPDTIEEFSKLVSSDTNFTLTALIHGILTIENKLRTSGELDSMHDVEGYEDFLKKNRH